MLPISQTSQIVGIPMGMNCATLIADLFVYCYASQSKLHHYIDSFTVATMTWLTVTEYLCHTWPRICFVITTLVLSSFMTYHRVCNKSNTTGDICGAGTAHPSGAPEVTPVFIWVRVSRSSVCVMICRFVLLSFFYWFLCCLSFFNLRLLITSLTSSSFSFQ